MNELLKNYELFCKCTLSQVEHNYDIRGMSLKFDFLQQIYIYTDMDSSLSIYSQ